ncbi:hypothetical protein SAMN05192539_10452 [Paraburkholderia diazotrophica]|uniref:Uncharacterized protein n=1 Tax=Paraburkholderia diazotrophica TaxID=667676 RepID=A0A1H7E6L7_9BURK|nr:hypothetical protein SAMN05192539_10452 [Paraburkholderia diazotrophica]
MALQTRRTEEVSDRTDSDWARGLVACRWRKRPLACSRVESRGQRCKPERHPASSYVRESVLSRQRRGLRSRVQKTAENDTCERDAETVRDYPELEINIFGSAKIKNHSLFFQRIPRFFRNKFPYRLRNIVVDGNKKAGRTSGHKRNNTGAVSNTTSRVKIARYEYIGPRFRSTQHTNRGAVLFKGQCPFRTFLFSCVRLTAAAIPLSQRFTRKQFTAVPPHAIRTGSRSGCGMRMRMLRIATSNKTD